MAHLHQEAWAVLLASPCLWAQPVGVSQDSLPLGLAGNSLCIKGEFELQLLTWPDLACLPTLLLLPWPASCPDECWMGDHQG